MPRSVAVAGVLWITVGASVSRGGENLFRVLAEAGVPVKAVEAPGSSLNAGRPGLEKMLLAAGVSERWNDEAFALGASPDADPRLIRLLLKAAEDPNIRFENGETALIRAVRQDIGEGVELLLDKGADVHLRDSRGHTALWHARRLGNPEIVKLLVGVGSELLPEVTEGRDPGDVITAAAPPSKRPNVWKQGWIK